MALKLDGMSDHRDLFVLAFLEGDTSGMQREADWARGKTNEFELLEAVAEAAAFAGKLQKAREAYAQAIESARRGKFEESAAGITARQAATEALVGNETQVRARALAALVMDRSRPTLFFAGLAQAMAGDARQAATIVDELSKRFPTDTFVSNIWVPRSVVKLRSTAAIPAKQSSCSRWHFLMRLASLHAWCPKWPLVATALLQLSVLRLSFLEDRRASATRQLRQTATKARMRSFVPPGG